MSKILKCTKKYLPYLLLTPVVMIAEVILEVKIPTVMADIVDIGIPSGDISVVTKYGIVMVGMAICSLCAGSLGTILSSTGSIGFGSELRREVFNKIQDFGFDDIDHFQQSSLITRLTTDIDFIQMGLRMCLTMVIRAPFMMVAAAVVAYGINKKLFVVFAVAAPILIVIIIALASIAMPLFKAMLEKFDGLNDRTKEYLTNIRVVKAFVRENHEKEKFSTSVRELMETSIKIEGLLALIMPIMMVTAYGCIIAIYWQGGIQIMQGSMQTGELIAFVSYVGQILSGLIMVAVIYIQIVRLKGSIDRINEVLNTNASIVDGPYDGNVEEGTIDFNNVSFRYASASKDAVKNINMHIKAGETIGVIGATGCGKTSIVQLIARLYDASEGELLVGGRNVKEYQLKNLRKDVAMVLQQNVLFSGTIKDNLRWGDENASDEDIIEACKNSCADEFISRFLDGYDTDLSQGGVNVSGGQKQRLCIARALLAKPKIIILDDSTSAVDTATDLKIRTALKENLKGTTTIIIAQRIASVMDADRVAVIDNGELVDFDTPANLLINNEIYRDIYTTQLKGVE